MRLINVDTIVLEEFPPHEIPRYAVLSHRWTTNEVKFTDIRIRRVWSYLRQTKFRGALRQAREDGLKYLWIDTCCIDKSSSAELSEAINSMYRWYQGAVRCYVYLQDVEKAYWQQSFSKSEWFKRGWTLQEMLAPSVVLFYDNEWRLLGDRVSLADIISSATDIPVEVLRTGNMDRYCIAQKMSWAAKRITTRPEDSAYCLMGLFGVNMPLLYGEQEKAFIRLQEEIIKNSDDHSIFAWSMGKMKYSGLLAPAPAHFTERGKTISGRSPEGRETFALTNRGLSIKLKITPWLAHIYLAYLDCEEERSQSSTVRLGIFLQRLQDDDQYVRIKSSESGLWFDTARHRRTKDRPIRDRQMFVRQDLGLEHENLRLADYVYGFRISDDWLPPSAKLSAFHYSPDDQIASLRPGDWGCIVAIDVSDERQGLRKIILGFDFDFHPVCFLEDSSASDHYRESIQHDLCDWSSVLSDSVKWGQIIEGRVFRQSDHNGVWALKGDRLYGLDVHLLRSFNDCGSCVTLNLERHGSQLVWRIHIDELVIPFKNINTKPSDIPFALRRLLKRNDSLDMTEEELELGGMTC